MKQKLTKGWKKIRLFFLEYADLFYRIALFFTVCLGLFFAIPSFLFGTEKDLADTPIGVNYRLQLDDVTLTQLERGYNEKLHYAEILLKVDGRMPEGGELKMLASESKTEQKVVHQLIPLTEKYYLIQLKQIPSNWKSIVIDIGIVSPTNPNFEPKSIDDLFETYGQKRNAQNEETVQDALFMSRRKVPIDAQVKPQNKANYLAKALELQIDESQKLIQENQELIRQREQAIEELEKEIHALEAERKYETQTEMEETNQVIQDRKMDIQAHQVTILEAEKNNQELEEKIKKVKQQIHDFSK